MIGDIIAELGQAVAEGILQSSGEAIHSRYGWVGCLIALVISLAIIGGIVAAVIAFAN